VVADRYELLDPVGRGGFGVVWRACDNLLQRHVAVKEITIPAILNDEERAGLREKVLKEARAAARLDHPGAVTVFDVIDDDGHPVIVMELVDAPNLSELVSQQGPLAPAEAARIGLEVLDVLDAAHAHGIVHRDVKPGNVMVSDAGRVRLGDFGVAAILDDPTVTSSGAITGSPAYMAPEQATNKGAVAASDLWSLGATLYFAVEGRPPFDKGAPLPTLTSIVQDPPRPHAHAGALGPVLDGLLVKDPAGRLAGPRLRDALELVASPPAEVPPAFADTVRPDDTMVIEEPVVAPPPPPPPPPAPAPAPPVTSRPAPVTRPPAPSRGSPLGWIAALAAVVVFALIAYGLTTREADPPSEGASPTTTAAAGTGAGRGSTASSAAPSGNRVTYTDPQTGFTIAHPRGWSVRTEGTLTDFRDPDTGAYLRVDHISPPGPSPEGAWFELERSFAAENENYQRIRIEPTTYSGYRAAIWEFTYSSGGAQLHVVDLGFITPRYGFALYFQTRAGDWDRMQSTFQAFKDSFKAPA
jgi:outer membrane biosynthesis protein TonB